MLIQNLFDMLAHIVAADFREPWESYSDIGEILLRHQVVSESEKRTLDQMAGFRNRLSHEYLSLDQGILIDVVNNRLADFSRFLRLIRDYCGI